MDSSCADYSVTMKTFSRQFFVALVLSADTLIGCVRQNSEVPAVSAFRLVLFLGRAPKKRATGRGIKELKWEERGVEGMSVKRLLTVQADSTTLPSRPEKPFSVVLATTSTVYAMQSTVQYSW